MIKNFNRAEKKALIAVAKFIANQDKQLSSAELEQFHNLATERGFEDFQELFGEVDAEIRTIQDLSKVVNSVDNSSTQKDIIEFAIDLARADGYESPEEHDTILYLSRVWDIDLDNLNTTDQQLLVSKVTIFIRGNV